MLNNTLERLRAMKMSAFADELECQIEDAENYNQLGFEDRLSLLVDCEWNRRQNNKLLRYIRNAHFSDSAATMEGIEYIEDRHLDKGKMPRSFFTEQALENLRRIVSNKAALIKHALNTDNLDIIESEHKTEFPWFTLTEEGDSAAYMQFIPMLCEFAKVRKRVVVKSASSDNIADDSINEKYAFRCFLLRLGMIGEKYKAARKVLLRNLTGSSAFRSGKTESSENLNQPEEGAQDENTVSE